MRVCVRVWCACVVCVCGVLYISPSPPTHRLSNRDKRPETISNEAWLVPMCFCCCSLPCLALFDRPHVVSHLCMSCLLSWLGRHM